MRDDPQSPLMPVRRLGVRPGVRSAAAGRGRWSRPLVAAADRAFRGLFSAVDTALDAAATRMGSTAPTCVALEGLDREVFLPLVFDGMRLLDGCSTESCNS